MDVLRAVACLLVVNSHLGYGRGTHSIWQAISHGGWIGVDLFFVLSGFLVSGVLFREYRIRGQIDVGRFLARRALRIYPAFYLFLAITSLAIAVLAKDRMMIASPRLFPELFFVQKYFPALGGTHGRWQSRNIFASALR
jgi:peptidoglycan/LPS O-acetylase OafA/YrhL